MLFDELKELIEQGTNKKDFYHPISFSLDDIFMIQSILYSGNIYCGNVTSIDEIYDIVTQYNLDSDLFNKPFYILASFDSYKNLNENTIAIINSLDDDIYVQVDLRDELNKEQLQLFLGINHARCQFNFLSWISLDDIDALVTKYSVCKEASPVVVLKEITFESIDKIVNVCEKIDKPRFRIEIHDAKSLQSLDDIIPYLPDEDVLVILDDELFNEKNPKNARNLIVQNRSEKEYSTKKLSISFQDMEYDSIEQVYELEKNLELIRSHIPDNAKDLDVITYVTLFMVNYFHYDYDMYNKEIKDEESDEINLSQLISRKKGLCRHFASFTKYFLNSLGIECERVDAFGDSIETPNGHAFNTVKIDDKLYFIDTTWIIGEMQNGTIQSLAESSNYLSSNNDFHHEAYGDEISAYECETYDRQEINESVKRVMNWGRIYIIHFQALKDLFRRYKLKKENSVAEKIEDAIPGRKVR